ncbi:MAG: hypothetical protein VKO64_12270 [Candidatus Sericytochromatia bacterium]|nr:hypothetical protein [Candidatus Sericytochromatia bacterium]
MAPIETPAVGQTPVGGTPEPQPSQDNPTQFGVSRPLLRAL